MVQPIYMMKSLPFMTSYILAKAVLLIVIVACVQTEGKPCHCKNTNDCGPIGNRGSGFEFFGFTRTQEPDEYKQYDWTKLTTAIITGVNSQTKDFACYAHSKNSRITVLIIPPSNMLGNAASRSKRKLGPLLNWLDGGTSRKTCFAKPTDSEDSAATSFDPSPPSQEASSLSTTQTEPPTATSFDPSSPSQAASSLRTTATQPLTATSFDISSPSQKSSTAYQPRGLNFPKRQFGQRQRAFLPSWFDKYEWLNYVPQPSDDDSKGDAVTCFVCQEAKSQKLFLPAQRLEESFINNGFCNWKKCPKRFEEHEKSLQHVAAENALKARTQTSVTSQMVKQAELDQVAHRRSLYAIFETVMFLGKQGLAFQGNEAIDGNFFNLMKLRSKDIPELHDWMTRRDKWFSHDIQNEMIEQVAEGVQRKIASILHEADFFSCIADGTQDITGNEQLTVLFRVVCPDLTTQDMFLGYYNISLQTKSNLLKYILSSFQILDRMLQALTHRFDDNFLKACCEIEATLIKACKGQVCDAAVSQEYFADVDAASFNRELSMLRTLAKQQKKDPNTFLDFITLLQNSDTSCLDFFPQVMKMTKLLLTFPVSVASAERSFSTLRRLKTWLRSCSDQKRLTALAVCNMHKSYVDELNLNFLYDEFILKTDERRKSFFFAALISLLLCYLFAVVSR